MTEQTSIFQVSNKDAEYAILCNALYEQQLLLLSQSSQNTNTLKSRISGLPYHIKRIAHGMLDSDAPLTLDLHNGAWQSKQSLKLPKHRYTAEQCHSWYSKYCCIGLTVSVQIDSVGEHHFELDTVDRIDQQKQLFHLNKHGWFNFYGKAVEQTSNTACYSLNRPYKTTLSAACCGHRWNHKGRVLPGRLSMRELLIALSIDWSTFQAQKNQSISHKSQ